MFPEGRNVVRWFSLRRGPAEHSQFTDANGDGVADRREEWFKARR